MGILVGLGQSSAQPSQGASDVTNWLPTAIVVAAPVIGAIHAFGKKDPSPGKVIGGSAIAGLGVGLAIETVGVTTVGSTSEPLPLEIIVPTLLVSGLLVWGGLALAVAGTKH